MLGFLTVRVELPSYGSEWKHGGFRAAHSCLMAMPQPPLQTGIIIDDHWRLERQLSAGASSSVWEAENLRLEGRVAIKFGLQPRAADSHQRERFLRESQAICRIRSPHVVQVLDRGVSHGLPYLVMELLEGEDLGALLARERTLSLSETASMLDQLCRGLAKVHSSGFVHRDIKPENVFIIHENDGGHFIKLLDFGIVKQLDSLEQPLTQQDMVVGTAHYLSPEQLERPRDVDQRADVWALGVLAYRMLFGKVAFEAESWQELCALILAAQFTAPSALRPDLPAELDGWFQQALARDRGARFQSVQGASAAFSSIARRHSSGELVRPLVPSAQPEYATTALAHTATRPRPRPTTRLALASALVAMLVVLCAWVAWERHNSLPRLRPVPARGSALEAPAPVPAAATVPNPSPVVQVPEAPSTRSAPEQPAPPKAHLPVRTPPAAPRVRKRPAPASVEPEPVLKDRGF